MDLITTSSPTSFLSTPRTRTPTGRMLSNKHVSESSCKWPGVYVVLHRTTIFYICICLWQMFWRNIFYFLFPGIHEVHLDPHRNIQSTILCPATTLCFISRMFCDYVISCVEARHNHDRSNFGANVGQIKQSLSTCGGFYTYRTEVVLGKELLGRMGLVCFGEKFLY